LAVIQIGLLVVLALYFGAQGIAYAQADPNYTFQATGCLSRNPTHVDPIVHYLKNQHIHYVWANNWVGDHITFETDDSIVATKTGIRIMSDYQALMHADRPSVLALAAHTDHHPDFLRELDANHVTYRVARFYSAPGVDALVVTPLNRTLSPSDGPARCFMGFVGVCRNEPWLARARAREIFPGGFAQMSDSAVILNLSCSLHPNKRRDMIS
jgi:hypothetical protein